jgi:hypothetical protein
MRTRGLLAALGVLLCASSAMAQSVHGVIVDQTGLVLPGVKVELHKADGTRVAIVTSSDGTFEFSGADAGETVEAALDGFETTRVLVKDAARIVMPLARASEQTVVTASALTSSGAVMERLGSTLTPQVAQRMPSARPRALESLPLLPSVVRGPDGLLRLDGTRPQEASLWIDGFDVTDPVTGTTAIDLPLESVRGLAVLRDPMAATFGGILGALASIETVAGGDEFAGGVQSFIPHPRLNRSGFGRIQGFFPRGYLSGRMGGVHYFAAQEYDFEQVTVPGVTTRAGRPTIGEISATSFARLDVGLSKRQTLTFETIFVPGHSAFAGMSPLRPPSASPTVRTRDLFAGVVDRVVISARDVLTVRVGLLAHDTAFGTHGNTEARLTPGGWRGNWFAATDHRAERQSLAISWDRTIPQRLGQHTVTIVGGIQQRSMHGGVVHYPIRIEDAEARLVRLIEFAPSAPFSAMDGAQELVVRDLWEPNDRWQVDVGVRMDRNRALGEGEWSPRLGIRYLVDRSGSTVLKAGAGRFVGRLPLHALSFSHFAARTDTTFDPASGDVESAYLQEPVSAALRLPRADSLTLELERRLRPGLDVQIGVRQRAGSALPTLNVTAGETRVFLESTGKSMYRELQLALRQVWREDEQFFFSYVRSAGRGELNDFATQYAEMETAQLEPGGLSRTSADTPNRWLLWGTFALPRDMVVSPATEWHTGFPYSAFDITRHYLGTPNSSRFPRFFSLDLVTYKTVEIRDRKVNLGLQLFNLTRHFNPRNVMSVAGTPQFHRLTNSVGLNVSGYMMVKWQ